MMHTAYLLIGIDISTTPPTVMGVDVASESPFEMTILGRNVRVAEIMQMTSQKSFQQAKDYLIQYMQGQEFRHHHAWIWALIEKQGGLR